MDLTAATRPRDHFALFGLERGFELDEPVLEQKLIALSRELHPDRLLAQGLAPSELAKRQRVALSLSASMNAAHATLKDPWKRADYLLGLLGGPGADKDRRTPPGFLEAILEEREAVEEARASGDREALARKRADLEARERATLDRLRRLFARADAADLPELRLELNAAKYVTNLRTEIDSALRG